MQSLQPSTKVIFRLSAGLVPNPAEQDPAPGWSQLRLRCSGAVHSHLHQGRPWANLAHGLWVWRVGKGCCTACPPCRLLRSLLSHCLSPTALTTDRCTERACISPRCAMGMPVEGGFAQQNKEGTGSWRICSGALVLRQSWGKLMGCILCSFAHTLIRLRHSKAGCEQ